MTKNPKKIRFVRKTYGRGWTPSTREGRTSLAVWLVWLIRWTNQFPEIDAGQHSASDTLLNFLPPIFLMTALLIALCYRKGEPPKWQRGKQKDK